MSNQGNQPQQAKQKIKQAVTNNLNRPQDPQNKISRRQFFFILVQTQIGVGVLSLPNELHQVAKQDGWISLLIAGSLIPIILTVLWLIARKYPEQSFFCINKQLFTKIGGNVLSIFYILYFICVGVLIVLLFNRMISLWVLPSTPFWVLSLLIISVGLYLANGGIVVIARFYTMVSFLLFILIILTIHSFQEVHFMYLLPIGEQGIGKILMGGKEAVLSFFGFFTSLVFFSLVEGKPVEKLRTMLGAHLFVLLFYLVTVFISFTFFSTVEVSIVPEPVLFMLKSFELPFVARVDLFFISIWFVSVATSFTTYVYMAGYGLKEIFQLNTTRVVNAIICTVTFIGALMIGYDMKKVEAFSTIVVNTGFVFTLFFPLLILIISTIKLRIMKGRESS